MKPLLAHIYEPHRVSYAEPVWVQPKFNGIRALYQAGHFQSRDQLPFPVGLLDHLAEPLRAIFDERTILDGELYVHGWPLQRINAAVTPVRQQPTADTILVEYWIFDRVDYAQPFAKRFGDVCAVIDHHKPTQIHVATTVNSSSAGWSDKFYAEVVGDGFEGIMYRLGNCPYTMPKQTRNRAIGEKGFLSDKDNRCWHLLKRKSWMDEEFTIHRVIEGEGKYTDMVGALECARDPNPAFNHHRFTVSGGLTDSERAKYWDHPELVVGKLVKVKYLCLSSDGIPLNPTILAIL